MGFLMIWPTCAEKILMLHFNKRIPLHIAEAHQNCTYSELWLICSLSTGHLNIQTASWVYHYCGWYDMSEQSEILFEIHSPLLAVHLTYSWINYFIEKMTKLHRIPYIHVATCLIGKYGQKYTNLFTSVSIQSIIQNNNWTTHILCVYFFCEDLDDQHHLYYSFHIPYKELSSCTWSVLTIMMSWLLRFEPIIESEKSQIDADYSRYYPSVIVFAIDKHISIKYPYWWQ